MKKFINEILLIYIYKMGFFKSSKKEIPAELPDLALDEASRKQIQENLGQSTEYKPFVNQDHKDNVHIQNILAIKPKKEIQIIDKESSQDETEKGFFKDMISNLMQESKNIEKVESFYNNRFMAGDIVNQMRNYWEEQTGSPNAPICPMCCI